MVSIANPYLFAVALVALVFFTVWSFWIPRIASRIHGALETRHPDLLRQIIRDHEPQSDIAMAWWFLPIAYGLDDEALSRDVALFKLVWVLSFLTLPIFAVCFYFALA